MKVFIWVRVDKCTDNYHEEGGVTVIAEDEGRARTLANSIKGCAIRQDEMPDRVVEADPSELEGAFIFPDAGCC